MERLCSFAESQPQVAHTAYTHGLKNKWSFLCRAMPDAATALAPVEQILKEKLSLDALSTMKSEPYLRYHADMEVLV